MSAYLKIVIAEPSAIIRSVLETMLKLLPGLRIQISEIANIDTLTEDLRTTNFEYARERDRRLRSQRYDQPRDSRPPVSLHPYRHHTPEEHRPQTTGTQCQCPYGLCHSEQAGRT